MRPAAATHGGPARPDGRREKQIVPHPPRTGESVYVYGDTVRTSSSQALVGEENSATVSHCSRLQMRVVPGVGAGLHFASTSGFAQSALSEILAGRFRLALGLSGQRPPDLERRERVEHGSSTAAGIPRTFKSNESSMHFHENH